jgi:copper chaperone CopZ
MTCASCEKRVTMAIRAVPRVRSVHVSSARGTATGDGAMVAISVVLLVTVQGARVRREQQLLADGFGAENERCRASTWF